jgi:WD40 repeat protein
VLHGHERGVHFLAFRDDDRHLVSASWDETVVMWDWRQGERLLLRPIPQLSAVLDLADGDRLAVGTGLGDVFTLQFQNIPAADTRE